MTKPAGKKTGNESISKPIHETDSKTTAVPESIRTVNRYQTSNQAKPASRKDMGGIDFVGRNYPQNHGPRERGEGGIEFRSRDHSQIDG